MEINIVNRSRNELPSYGTVSSSGCDLRASLQAEVTILPGERVLIPTGLYMAIPEGYEGQVRPRSGLAVKHGITVLNTPGTIDADYRGEVKVLLINLGAYPYIIKPGERIAQLVFARYEKAIFNPVDKLDTTQRGEGGFGHTGVE